MTINPPILWYENEHGDRWMPPPGFPTGDCTSPPEGFRYQHSRIPCEVHENVVELVNGGVRLMYTGTSSWPPDLVLAMTRPTAEERAKQVERYGSEAETYSLTQAILYAAGCEHCINTLAHRHGLDWGYQANGPEDRSRTRCVSCRLSTDAERRLGLLEPEAA